LSLSRSARKRATTPLASDAANRPVAGLACVWIARSDPTCGRRAGRRVAAPDPAAAPFGTRPGPAVALRDVVLHVARRLLGALDHRERNEMLTLLRRAPAGLPAT